MRWKLIVLMGLYLSGCSGHVPLARAEAASQAKSVAVDGLMAGIPEAKLCASFRLRESFQLLSGKLAAEAESVPMPGLSSGVPTVQIPTGLPGPVEASAHPSLTLLEEFASYRRELSSKLTAGASIPARKSLKRLFRFCRERNMVPDNLYVFLNPPEDYAIFVTGSVDPNRWRELFPSDRIMNRPSGFAVTNTGSGQPNPPLLHVGQGYLLVCPANLEGTILDGLLSGQTQLPPRFATFAKMSSRNPIFALEADLSGLFSGLGPTWSRDNELPEALRHVQVCRLIAEPGIVKGQLYTEHEPARPQLIQFGNLLTESLRRSLMAVPRVPDDPLRILAESLKANFQGKSVFLEGAGLGKTTGEVSSTQLAILAWLASGGALNRE